MASTDSVARQLDKSRLDLLDLSTRNRLLSTPRHSPSARTIEIAGARGSEVFRLLVRDGKALGFIPTPDRPAPDRTEALPGLPAAGGEDPEPGALPQPDEEDETAGEPAGEPGGERGAASRPADLRLQTLLTSQALQKRLLAMFYDARTFKEEQGVNILYLAVGMLRWHEPAAPAVARWAPLILVPVALDRHSAAERFRLRRLEEDPSPNLSLIAKLKSEFGILLPEFPDPDELDPAAYCAAVAAAVADQPDWAVLPDDLVLGFFSFAKFLMYRDLDPANWPRAAPLDRHPLVSGLLRDGFAATEGLLGEDEPVDPHIPPAAMVHILDADSSQSVAIEEARRGRNLVIQGPPGTGKSQTIANIIAAAVAAGRTVLFVAEKMAALEVVKRRLDQAGLGPVCLELHSHKAGKRLLLDELKRSWEIGRPREEDGDGLLRRLEQLRDGLNRHSARVNLPHHPSGLAPVAAMGQLLRMQRAGHAPPDFTLPEAAAWTAEEREDRAQLLADLAGRIAAMGRPADHPWRGVRRDSILRTDLDRLVPRLDAAAARLRAVVAEGQALAALLAVAAPETAGAAARLAVMGREVATAPDHDRAAIAAEAWEANRQDIADLVAAGSTLSAARAELGAKVAEIAWTTDVAATRLALAAYGESWLRWLNGDYRRAQAMLRGLLAVPPPETLAARLALLDRLIAAQQAAARIARDEAIGRAAFGAKWRREGSDWPALRAILDWTEGHRRQKLPPDFRRVAAQVADAAEAGRRAAALAGLLAELRAELDRLFADLALDLGIAFGVRKADAVPFAALAERLGQWSVRAEDLSKWIALNLRLDQARAAGLEPLVERLWDGRLDPGRLAASFAMACAEAVMKAVVAAEPELARFDGEAHDRLVQEFRAADRRRIELARIEVALAHYRRLPKGDGGIGPLGVLRGEMAKRRGHLPIRRLMRAAGPAIQALKPVFMMSPLSVAQFLEPGSLTFDLLLIDEASQVEPVDALGAVARARQIVVVGDDRQLPPTGFFRKLTGEDAAGADDADADDADADEDGVVAVGQLESILGLCLAKGLPQRMLRWHYRSRHPSLIAVSNREFYENRLYIVPSPVSDEAGLGLRFHHLPQGVFDSGGSGTHPVEARAVAEAVLRHALAAPGLSLGVGTFSIRQRQAILDELERLRRARPELEPFFAAHPAEPFFVKNLETIQGDERDVIFISVGYGRNAGGTLAMRFGPLSHDGGERRLNVLISRARRRCEVFSAITDEDIDLERGHGRGVAALKLFLHYARTGRLALGRATGREPDSIFEEEVAAALRAEGYKVHSQVGLAGFFIDLAVADPERPGRYILGIECDGAAYHSARSARDRDRLRQAVLEDNGWIIHRIWSTDWFQRPQEQLRRTVAAIEAARAALSARQDSPAAMPGPEEGAVPAEPIAREAAPAGGAAAPAALSVPYREARFPVPADRPLHAVPPAAMARLVEQVVAVEGPIHADEVIARIRSLWGLSRAGGRIQAAVLAGLEVAVARHGLVKDGTFYAKRGTPLVVRDRSAAESPSLKKPDTLPPAEIRAAILALLEANYGAAREELPTGVARLLGFQATSRQLKAVVEREMAHLLATGALEERDRTLAIRTAAMA